MKRLSSPLALREAIKLSRGFEVTPFDEYEWLSNQRNIALEEEESVGTFEELTSGVYNAHYFFKVRGKAAKNLALRMIDYVFDCGGIVIQGLVPVENKPVARITSQLGFTSYGIIDTWAGECKLFIRLKDI